MPGSAEGLGDALGSWLGRLLDGGVGMASGGAEGRAGSAGPDETTSATDVPTATDRPASGLVEMTDPGGTMGSGARVVDPTRRPAVVIAKTASVWGEPSTSGTATSSRAVDTVGVIVDPTATIVPGPGDWLMTVPSG